MATVSVDAQPATVKKRIHNGERRPARKRARILLGQLGSYGDCLYATAVARQIKADFPDCHLTWAIASAYSDVLLGNPHVDEVWEIPYHSRREIEDGWNSFANTAMDRKRRGDFDRVFLTQFSPGNVHRFDGSLRFAIYRGYPNPITVPFAPVLRLSGKEVANVSRFAEVHRLREMLHVVLFECAPKSSQSFVTPELALAIATEVISRIPGVCFILSSNSKAHATDERIIDGSVLSFRENAELTKYCSLLVGCSSGISWVATSEWAKPLPMIQLLQSDAFLTNSLVLDAQRCAASSENLIEMTECPLGRIVECVVQVIEGGVKAAKPRFHSPVPVRFHAYRQIHNYLFGERMYWKAARFFALNARLHGTNSYFLSELLRILDGWLGGPIGVVNGWRVRLAIRQMPKKLVAYIRGRLPC